MTPKPPPPEPELVRVKRFAVAWGTGQSTAIAEFQNRAQALIDEGFEPAGGIAAAMFGTTPAIIQSFYKPERLALSTYEPCESNVPR